MTAANGEAAGLRELLAYIRAARGFDFTGYKRSSLVRRIRRRMHDVGVTTFEEYLDYLQVHPGEFVTLFNTILINVTSFFRDPEAWDVLATEVLPGIVAEGRPIRAWSAGCASGEEAYTLAMLLAEAVGPDSFGDRVKIFATDVDEEALAVARHASYAEKLVEVVPKELREKYFTANGGSFVFRGDLRRAISFGRHDLVQDAPISRLDLLLSRNTLMYFDAETQARVLSRFCFALKDSGVLFLGKAEMLFSHARLFALLNLKHRLFCRIGVPSDRRDWIAAAAPLPAPAEPDDAIRRMRVRDLVFDVSPMATIVVDAEGAVTQVNDRARSQFRLDDRDLGRPLQDLEISYRPIELRSKIEEAYEKRGPLNVKTERVAPDGTVQHFVVHFTPLFSGDARLGAVVTYEDVTEVLRLGEDLRQSNQQLENALEELQSTNEELETTNEELQSTNEELETTLEELQSTNEELETMNAEMMSSNEHLDAVNREIVERSRSLEDANLFQASVFASVQSGLVVIDPDSRVRIWNAQAEELWGVRADEAIGRSLFSLEIGLPLEPLREPVAAQLAGRDFARDSLLPATNRHGKAIDCRVSCTPLRGRDDQIGGVILMMESRESRESRAPEADGGGASTS